MAPAVGPFSRLDADEPKNLLHAAARQFCRQTASLRISWSMSTEKATFGAGCFWGVEAAFAAIPGVTATAVGYEGGELQQPTYRDVCTDSTGHAEVVEVEFDPQIVTYEHLLDAFFSLHDPTTLNRQGPDWGTQYRSAIFFHSDQQHVAAVAKIQQLTSEGRYQPKRIVTKVEPAQVFWKAEDYHQRYLEKRGLGSCHI
jgi:peptide-methionine (S)-S-oxide reductase